MSEKSILKAFDQLITEFENTLKKTNIQGSALLAKGNYSEVEQVIEKGKKITDQVLRIKTLRETWTHYFQAPLSEKNTERDSGLLMPRIKRENPLSKGLRTNEKLYTVPILETLIELGGEAPMKIVLEGVERKLKSQLTRDDYEHIPSDERVIRWQNTAQWAKFKLVSSGLMAKDAQRGIWKITEEGRQAQQNHE